MHRTCIIFTCFAAQCLDYSNTFQTEPVLIKNTLAKNFNGLKLSTKFLLIGDFYIWSHRAFNPYVQTIIYTSLALCANNIQNGFKVTCQRVSCERSTYKVSSLTVMFPLDKDITFAVIEAGYNQVQLASIDIKVKGKLISF